MDEEHIILNHYNIATPDPIAWPPGKDSDVSDEDIASKPGGKSNLRRSKTRYSALERSDGDRRNLVPGSEKTGDGVENLVQRDEADPLGGTDSVVRVLRQKGIAVEDDHRLRNRFLLSSTTFSPNLYLSQIHSNTSAQSLLQGLEFLSRSIDQKSASLKVLVESNFERFVRAKTTIDNVYAEMRNQGVEAEAEKPRPHSRTTNKGSNTHFRTTSGQTSTNSTKGVYKTLSNDKRKNALAKESEYGVQGIKGPLIEVAVKAEEIWGPALGSREKEESLRLILDSVAQRQDIFNRLPAISDCIKRRDYKHLVEEYSRARKYVDQAREVANQAMNDRVPLTDSQVHQIVITGRMWSEVEDRIDDFKRSIWRKLTNTQGTPSQHPGRTAHEECMALISILLELGVEDSPIWVWLLSRYDGLKNKISASSERFRVEIEVIRRRLANAETPASQTLAAHLKASAQNRLGDKFNELDMAPVIELWDMILSSITNLVSVKTGILGEILEFWEKSQLFIDGKVQNTLPVGIDGQSQIHHRLSADGSRQLQDGVIELIELLRENVFSFFADPPIEDISMLYSPNPQTPNSPNTPVSAPPSLLGHQNRRFKFDISQPPPPSPKRGEFWDEFAFWPPHSNSLSGTYYLGKILNLLGVAASEILAIKSIALAASLPEKLRIMIAGARDRSARAICAAWNRDAEIFNVLEDWTRSKEKRDLTAVPAYFSSFEGDVISGIQKILYILDVASNKPGSTSLISPPPAKLLQMVRSQFVMTLYRVLSSMVENAEKPNNDDSPGWISELNMTHELGRGVVSKDMYENSINMKSRNIRMLLTLSNLKVLQSEIVPQLISQFETSFSLKLTDESKKVRDNFAQTDAKLFQSYTRPAADQLSSMIHTGISASAWPPTTGRPTQVRPYVYRALLLLVDIHTEIVTTAASLTNPILSHLLEVMSVSFLEAFKARGRYSLPALMQATLDLEFVAQTMSQYTTDRISRIQNDIYVELDRCTDNEARTKSKDEVLEIGVILKKLREGTKTEFACFKRPRGQKER